MDFSPKHRKEKESTLVKAVLVRTRITYLTTTKAFLPLTDKRNLKSPIQINSIYVNAEALRQP